MIEITCSTAVVILIPTQLNSNTILIPYALTGIGTVTINDFTTNQANCDI